MSSKFTVFFFAVIICHFTQPSCHVNNNFIQLSTSTFILFSPRWLLLENEDPVGELQWLVDTLLAAEAAGEIVHLLGHIPPSSDDCDHTWSHIFNQIVTR